MRKLVAACPTPHCTDQRRRPDSLTRGRQHQSVNVEKDPRSRELHSMLAPDGVGLRLLTATARLTS
jgi:hypothetical protein